MQDPTRLEVYREAEALAVDVYVVTRAFPADERFGMTAQLRRAAVGVGSCIAEGCGRYKPLDKAMFFSRALGSVREVGFQLRLSLRVGLVSDPEALKLVVERADRLERMLNSLIRRVRASG